MQDISATSLAASYAAERPACFMLEADWGAVAWVDESDNVMTIDVTTEVSDSRYGAAPAGNLIADSADITLRNTSRRFTPWYPTGPLHAYIADGAWDGTPVRISVGYLDARDKPEYVSVFHGVQKVFTHSIKGQVAKLRCLDNFALLSNFTLKTALYGDISISDAAEVIRAAILPTPPAKATWDASLFGIPAFWCDDEIPLQEFEKLAIAECGRIYCRQSDGALMFENAAHLAIPPHTTSVATFSVDKFEDMASEYKLLDRTKRVQVFYKPWALETTTDVWTKPDAAVLPAGETTHFRATFQSAVTNLNTALVAKEDYYVSTYGFEDACDQVTITVNAWAQQAVVNITNNAATDLILNRVRLRGQLVRFMNEESVCLVIGSDGTITEEVAADVALLPAGKMPLVVRDNWFIQTREHAQALAYLLAYRVLHPRQTVTLTGLRAMPWLETGDRVTVTERLGTGVADFYVHRIVLHLKEGIATMDLLLMAADYYFASDVYFRLGTDAIGAGAVYFP